MPSTLQSIAKPILSGLLCLLLATPAFSEQKPAQLIRIAAIDWCPQICPNEQDKGYIIDIVQQLFANSPYQLSIDYLPWSRAIHDVRQGRYMALLSPAKPEAPDLIYPEQAIGAQTMCFFTEQDSPWQYHGQHSLQGLRIGIAPDTSLVELNQFKQDNPELFHEVPYSERYLQQQVSKLMDKRIDTFLFTRNTTLFELEKLGLTGQIKIAGCVSKTPIYMAFSNHPQQQKRVSRLTTFFDTGMSQLRQSDRLNQILRRYQLSAKDI